MYSIAAISRGKQITCNQNRGFILAYRVNMEKEYNTNHLYILVRTLKVIFKVVCDSLPMMGNAVNNIGIS